MGIIYITAFEFFRTKFKNCPMKTMNLKKSRQVLKKEHTHRLIIVNFGISLTIAKKSV